MISPKEFVRLWNLLQKRAQKVVTTDTTPEVLMTLDYEQELFDNLGLVIERVNRDPEFQASLARPIELKETVQDKQIIIKSSAYETNVNNSKT